MRLLRVDTLEFESVAEPNIPDYAIASHRWYDDEASYTDWRDKTNVNSKGYKKIEQFVDYVRANLPKISYLWIDTCCIDKRNPVDINEALTSMWRWYRDAAICLAYLVDVERDMHVSFTKSVWFKRGWTLQEMIAPKIVLFLDKEWQVIGSKVEDKATLPDTELGRRVTTELAEATRIREEVLRDYDTASRWISDAEKWQWYGDRKTKRSEDEFYCQMGIFDVSLEPMYGELRSKAKARFLKALEKSKSSMPTVPSMFNPLGYDRNAVNRGEFFETGHRKAQRIGLVGRGGIGKTTLALQYAHTVFDQRSSTWVFLIQADTIDNFNKSIMDVIKFAKLPSGRSISQDLRTLQTWLSEAINHWLIILDGVVEADFLHECPDGSETRRIDYFPTNHHGQLLITSRSKTAVHDFIFTMADIISVSDMTVSQGLQLLEANVLKDIQTDREDLVQIVEELDCTPLALAQAAAYINIKHLDSVKLYLDKIRRGSRSRLEILSTHINQAGRPPGSENSILTSVLSFEHAKKRSPGAARLLAFLSVCDCCYIPGCLLTCDSVDTRDQGDARIVEEEIAMLMDLHLLESLRGADAFKMHSLVHLAATAWQHSISVRHDSEVLLISRLVRCFPERPEITDARTLCTSLMPHIVATLSFDLQRDEERLQHAGLLDRVARYELRHGSMNRALAVINTSLQYRLAISGPEHNDTIESESILARVYCGMGKWTEAIDIQTRLVNLCRRLFGPDDERTLSRLDELASSYSTTQAWTDAERIRGELLSAFKKSHASDDPARVACTIEMAKICIGTGRFAEAEVHYLDVLEIRQRAPDNAIELAHVKGDLAVVYKKLGDLTLALEYQKDVLDVRRRILGESDQHTIIAMVHLASTERAMGNFHGSLELGERALKAARLRFNEPSKDEDKDTHPYILNCMNDLSISHIGLKNWKAAEELQMHVLTVSSRQFGEDQLRTLTAKANLAATYRNTGRLDEAEALERVVIEGREKCLEKSHPDMLRARYNLGLTLGEQGRLDKAIKLIKTTVDLRKHKYGDDQAEMKEEQAALRRLLHKKRGRSLLRSPWSIEQVWPMFGLSAIGLLLYFGMRGLRVWRQYAPL